MHPGFPKWNRHSVQLSQTFCRGPLNQRKGAGKRVPQALTRCSALCEDRLRLCSSCRRSKALREFPRLPLEPFEFQFECKECMLGFALPSAEQRAKGNAAVIAKQTKLVQRLQADYEYTHGQIRFKNTMDDLEACAKASKCPVTEEAANQLRDPQFFQERMDMLSMFLCIPDKATVVELIRRQSDLLLLPPEVLAGRLAALKAALPHADVFALINHGPWLLLLQDAEDTLLPALRQVQKLMPSFDVAGKVHEGTGVWWSALDIMKQSRRQYTYS